MNRATFRAIVYLAFSNITTIAEDPKSIWHYYSQATFQCKNDPIHSLIQSAFEANRPNYQKWVLDHFPGWIKVARPKLNDDCDDLTGLFLFEEFNFIEGKNKYSVYTKQNEDGWDGKKSFIEKTGLVGGWKYRMNARYYIRPVFPFIYKSHLVSVVGVVGDNRVLIEIRDAKTGLLISEIAVPEQVKPSESLFLSYEIWPFVSNGFIFICANSYEIGATPKWIGDKRQQTPGAPPVFLVCDIRRHSGLISSK